MCSWLMKYKSLGNCGAEGEAAQGSMRRALGGVTPLMRLLALLGALCLQLCSENLPQPQRGPQHLLPGVVAGIKGVV